MFSETHQVLVKEEPDEDEKKGIEALLTLSCQNQWTITKKLTESDVNPDECRLLIGKAQIQSHVFSKLDKRRRDQIRSKTGLNVRVRDADKDKVFGLVLKEWKSMGCLVFVGGWMNEFVRRRELNKGDAIGMFYNGIQDLFVFSVLSRATPPDLLKGPTA